MTNEELVIRAIDKMSKNYCSFTINEKGFNHNDIYVNWVDVNNYHYHLALRKSDKKGTKHDCLSDDFFDNLVVKFRYIKVFNDDTDDYPIYYNSCFVKDGEDIITNHCQWVIESFRNKWHSDTVITNDKNYNRNDEIAKKLGL